MATEEKLKNSALSESQIEEIHEDKRNDQPNREPSVVVKEKVSFLFLNYTQFFQAT